MDYHPYQKFFANLDAIRLCFRKAVGFHDTFCLIKMSRSMHRKYRVAIVEAVSNKSRQRRSDDCFHRVDIRRQFSQMFDQLSLMLAVTLDDIAADLTRRRLGPGRRL